MERKTDKLLHLPDVIEFRSLFPEYAWREEDAPTARTLAVKRHRQRRGGFHFENIAVGPYCAIVKPGVPPSRCYVSCSDQVFDVIHRRMPTPSRKSRVSFDVNVGSDGFATVSAQSAGSEKRLLLARINAASIPEQGAMDRGNHTVNTAPGVR